MSTVLGYDSTNPLDIPSNAKVVAGYVDGPFAWTREEWMRFPLAYKVRIATRASTNDGDIIDCEKGDATPAQAVLWVIKRRQAGAHWAGIYCNLSTLTEVRAALGTLICPLWQAHYDDIEILPNGFVGKQFINPPNSGGHFDLSVFDLHWLDSIGGNVSTPADNAHAVESYKNPDDPTDVDVHQHEVDATTAKNEGAQLLTLVNGLVKSVMANQTALNQISTRLDALEQSGRITQLTLSGTLNATSQ